MLSHLRYMNCDRGRKSVYPTDYFNIQQHILTPQTHITNLIDEIESVCVFIYIQRMEMRIE